MTSFKFQLDRCKNLHIFPVCNLLNIRDVETSEVSGVASARIETDQSSNFVSKITLGDFRSLVVVSGVRGYMSKKVLVLCTGNSCRSQMAEGLINARLGPEFQAFSAGTEPNSYVHPKAITVMAELGIDLIQNETKDLEKFRGQYFDYVITVCDSASENCPVWLGKAGIRYHIGFDDPAKAVGTEEEVMAEFRRVRDEIAAQLLNFLQEQAQNGKNKYEKLANRVKLLAHPERLRILDALRREAECVCHLEALLAKPQPYVSQQLRLLREAGVIQNEQVGHNVYYRLVDPEVTIWLDEILGPVEGEPPELVHYKQIISCDCPKCEGTEEVILPALEQPSPV